MTIKERKGSLEPGKYILLRYLDPPWTGYYDTFKLINDDLLVGRVYLGDFPNGVRVFTFAMTRKYGFDEMTVADHQTLFAAGTVPTKEELNGVWRMDMIGNNNHLGRAAYLRFELKPDGRLESTYQLLGLFEGLVLPSFTQDHFQLNDFTPFHDEIRKVDPNFMAGRYVTGMLPDLSGALGGPDLGILHSVPGTRQLGFYYTLTRAAADTLPTGALLAPFLDVRLPDGLGMTFDEQLVGWYFEGGHTDRPGREGDLALADRVRAPGDPEGGTPCVLDARMTVRDLNEFVDGYAHEAAMTGRIQFRGRTFPVGGQSAFHYLIVNPATKEAEMRYHVEFTDDGKRFVLEGRKYMHRTGAGALNAIREVLYNYTTLYCHVFESAGGGLTEIGTALLKFRTFEDLAAVGSTAAFLASFTVTGTNDPLLKLQGQMRFLAFTAQFVQREYDPLSPDLGSLSLDVEAELLRGAATPDYFSSRGTGDLQAILRDAPTQPVENLVNTRAVRVDVANRRIHRDLFWKGSFAKDSLLGWEERLRNAAIGRDAAKAGEIFTAGAFWKRFDQLKDGAATGFVVNYDLDAIPGDPEVRAITYPDDNRRYFRKGDKVLLLRYRNAPYRPVYDTIKIVDADSAIGVMHLGEFPNGVEAATFVMERYSYPFEDMSIEDHRMLFSDANLSAPLAGGLAGAWIGNFIVLERPNTALLRRPLRPRLSLAVDSNGAFEASGIKGTFPREDMRSVGADTIIGRWRCTSPHPNLRGLAEAYSDGLALYYVLRRA